MQTMINNQLQLAELEPALVELHHVDHRALRPKSLLGMLFFIVLTSVLLACNAPGDQAEAIGTIVSVEAQATKSGALRTVHVRLEDNRTVRASVKGRVAMQVGAQVRLTVSKMPVIGLEEFDVKELIEVQNGPPQ